MLLISNSHTMGLVKYRDPYPFGVDPSWRGSRSELPFLNSLKMKMSILLGVTQMNLGIILSYFNARFFGSSLDIRCVLGFPSDCFRSSIIVVFAWKSDKDEHTDDLSVCRYQFIPQIIFLNSLFGYLALLIVIKWCTGSQADLYHVMIYMFLSPTDDLGENELFWGQRGLQVWSLTHLFLFSTLLFFKIIELCIIDLVVYTVFRRSFCCSWQLLQFLGCFFRNLLFWESCMQRLVNFQ